MMLNENDYSHKYNQEQKPAPFHVSNSPSHRAITQLAKVFPITFTDVRAISINSSIPKMAMTGHTGKPKEETVPNKIINDARGTPATPLLVSINVSPIII